MKHLHSCGRINLYTSTCQHLHHTLLRLPRLRREDLARVSDNGIYVLFENGEPGHDGKRVVRVGTHRGQNNLPGRIRKHLYKTDKDRSIFRKHVGCCLLAKVGDPFLAQWEIDLTTKASCASNEGKVDKIRLQEVEADVTRDMVENFSFAVLMLLPVWQDWSGIGGRITPDTHAST